jgi:FtsZ-interacting cell division protein ZipA
MDTRIVIPIVVIIIAILLAVVAALAVRRRKSEKLKQRFGPEYDRTVLEQHGDSHRAEAALADREKRVEAFPLRALSAVDREAYAMEWAAVQRRFVDDPSAAVAAADRLVNRAMADRGYPMSDFEQRAADVSVSYPTVVENYRAAHDIVVRHADGNATTEELRQAMVHYRSLFDELLEPGKIEAINQNRRRVKHERAS